MFKKSLTSTAYLMLTVMLALMPVMPVAAMPAGEAPPPKESPSGEVLYAEPFSRVESIKPSGGMAPTATSGCKSFTKGIDIYNSLGIKVATYAQKIDWCYNGSTITSKSRIRWGTVYSPLYQFNGHIGNQEAGGVGRSYYYAWTQGSFCELAPGFGCVWYFYPWVEQYVYGNGSYWGNAGW